MEDFISNVRTKAPEAAAAATSLAPRYKRAGGAEFVSPALQRGENGFHKFVTESHRDGARTLFMQEPTTHIPQSLLPIP